MSLEWWMMVTKRNPKWPVAVAIAVSQGIDKWFLCKLHGLHMIKNTMRRSAIPQVALKSEAGDSEDQHSGPSLGEILYKLIINLRTFFRANWIKPKMNRNWRFYNNIGPRRIKESSIQIRK